MLAPALLLVLLKMSWPCKSTFCCI